MPRAKKKIVPSASEVIETVGKTGVTPETLEEMEYLFVHQAIDCNKLGAWYKIDHRQMYRLRDEGQWAEKREVLLSKLRDNADSVQQETFKRVVNLGTQVIEKQLLDHLQAGSKLSIKDAKLLSDTVSNYWRICQVNEGKATNITKQENLTPEEYQAKLRELMKGVTDDPLYNPEVLVDESKPDTIN